MMIEEMNMNAGDLVVATEAAFEGTVALSVGTPGLIKDIAYGPLPGDAQVLVYWTRYGFQSWEHPDAIKVVSSIKN
jgi:hypothetical protein